MTFREKPPTVKPLHRLTFLINLRLKSKRKNLSCFIKELSCMRTYVYFNLHNLPSTYLYVRYAIVEINFAITKCH